MCSVISLTLIVALMTLYSVVLIVISQESCKVCNYQFNNIRVLDQLIDAKLNTPFTGKLNISIIVIQPCSWPTMNHS